MKIPILLKNTLVATATLFTCVAHAQDILSNNFNSVTPSTTAYDGPQGVAFGTDPLLGNATGLQANQAVNATGGVSNSAMLTSNNNAVRSRGKADITGKTSFSVDFKYSAGTVITNRRGFISAGWALPNATDNQSFFNGGGTGGSSGNSNRLLISVGWTGVNNTQAKFLFNDRLNVMQDLAGVAGDTTTFTLVNNNWYQLSFDLQFDGTSNWTVTNLALRNWGADGVTGGNVIGSIATKTFNPNVGGDMDSNHLAHAVFAANGTVANGGAATFDELVVVGPPPKHPEIQLGLGADARCFTNLAKYIKEWSKENKWEATYTFSFNELDSHGYPILTPGQVAWVNSTHCGAFGGGDTYTRNSARYLHEGVHVMTWTGDATLEVLTNATTAIVSSVPGRIVFLRSVNTDGNFDPRYTLKITAGPNYATNPLRNLAIWLPDPADRQNSALEPHLNPLHPVHPLWAEYFTGPEFGIYRFYDTISGSFSPVVDWTERTPPYYSSYKMEVTDRIVPGGTTTNISGYNFEDLIRLCNVTGKHFWITVPHGGTDDMFTKLAQLLKYGSDADGNPYTSPQASPVNPPLDPALKVYLEYSNETWNTGFDCYDYCSQQGFARGLDPAVSYTGATRFAAQRSAELFSIFQSVYGGDSNRLVRIMSTRTSQVSDTDSRLAEVFAHGATLSPASQPDVLAITSYLGGGIQDWIFDQDNIDFWNLTEDNLNKAHDEMLKRLLSGQSGTTWVDNVGAVAQGHFDAATTYEIDVIAYEGGIGLPLNPRKEVYYPGYSPTNKPPLNTGIPIEGNINSTHPDRIGAELAAHGAYKTGAGDSNGNALTRFIDAFLDHPRCGTAIDVYLNIAKAQGLKTHAQFGDHGFYSKWGQWATIDYPGQDPAASPRYISTLNYANEQAAIREISDPIGSVPQFTTDTKLPTGIVGDYYSVTIDYTGATSAEVLVNTALPAGLTLSTNPLRINGTPTATGGAFIFVRILDADGDPAWRVFDLRIVERHSPEIFIDFEGLPTGKVAGPNQPYLLGGMQFTHAKDIYIKDKGGSRAMDAEGYGLMTIKRDDGSAFGLTSLDLMMDRNASVDQMYAVLTGYAVDGFTESVVVPLPVVNQWYHVELDWLSLDRFTIAWVDGPTGTKDGNLDNLWINGIP